MSGEGGLADLDGDGVWRGELEAGAGQRGTLFLSMEASRRAVPHPELP